MSKAPAVAKSAANSAAGGRTGRGLILGLVCGIALAAMPGFAALGAILMAPGIFACMFDAAPGKPSARAVLLLGVATAIAPGFALWSDGVSVPSAIALATQPPTIGLSWSAQGAGWLAMELAPALVRAVLEATARARALALRRMRGRIEAEWSIAPLEGE